MTINVGDFVKCPSGIGCPPKFGIVMGLGTVSPYKIPVGVVKTRPGVLEAFPIEYLLPYPGCHDG